MPSIRRLAAALLMLVPTACASLPPCPARGGPAWTEWTTPHFEILTDLDDEDARGAVKGFEELRAAVLQAAWRRAPEPRGRLLVVLFRGERERRVFVPARYVAQFVGSSPPQPSLIIKSGSERDDIVTHELVHALAHHYGLLGKANWFDEGLARYLAPLRLDPDGALTYGQVDEELFRAVTRGRLTAFENLWRPVSNENSDSFHATSWLAVHYLFNNEGARFDEFQRRLIDSSDARASWNEVFPDLTPEVFDARLAQYAFREGQFSVFKTRLLFPPFEAKSTPLADSDVHAIRALLYATMMRPGAEQPRPSLRAEVAEALRLDPLQGLALFIQRFLLRENEADLATAKKLVALRPNDALAWMVLARARSARHENDEAEEAWDQVRHIAGSREASFDRELRVARPD
jgi:hypothetical protein